jgi:hypothetical protein
MLDDFREQASGSAFDSEKETPFEETPRPQRRFLGMTPAQRFVVALILLLMTCLLSTFCLLVTERVVLPFIR